MRRRGGFALIAALWLLIALSAVGLDAALRSQERRLAAANVLDQTRARGAAMAGAEYARSRLSSAMLGRAEEIRDEILSGTTSDRSRRRVERMGLGRLAGSGDPFEDPWRAPMELVQPEMAFGDARYSLLMRDVGESLNINEASEEMLRQFFSLGLRIDFAEADEITQAILDWRDEDDLPRVNGGEREQYLDEGRAVLPANRPFAELNELINVRGVTPWIFQQAVPYLTLVGDGDININAAPEPVLLAAPGMTEAAAAEIIRFRESGTLPRRERDLRSLLPAGAWAAIDRRERQFERATTFETEQVEIVAEGWVEGGPIRVRAHLVVSRSNTGAVVVWRRIG